MERKVGAVVDDEFAGIPPNHSRKLPDWVYWMDMVYHRPYYGGSMCRQVVGVHGPCE